MSGLSLKIDIITLEDGSTQSAIDFHANRESQVVSLKELLTMQESILESLIKTHTRIMAAHGHKGSEIKWEASE